MEDGNAITLCGHTSRLSRHRALPSSPRGASSTAYDFDTDTILKRSDNGRIKNKLR